MATLNVSSMSQFIYALENAVSDDVIEILADLDFNDVYSSFETRVAIAGGVAISDLTINGNNHAIYNMDTQCLTSNTSLFRIPSIQTGHYFTVNSLSFLNCRVNKSRRLFDSTQSDHTKIIFNNCVFQGSFQECPLNMPCKVVDSMLTFNITSKGNLLHVGSSSSQPRWIRCWIWFDRVDTNKNSIFGTSLTQCYLGGTLSVYHDNNSSILFNGLDSCCYNVQTNLTGLSAPVITTIFSNASNSPTVINVDKLTMLTTWSDTTYLKLVTDEQMHDAEELALVGFDIIV